MAVSRPGGRTARVRADVLRAAGDLVVERGFAQLDLAEVARRAEVGRTTVYRRWGTAIALVTDLLLDMAEQSSPRADTGDLAEDLRANARLVQRTLADERQGALFKAVIAAATWDEQAATALRGFYRTRVDEWAPCVVAAIDRGELPAGSDAKAVIRAVSAPLYYELLITGQVPDEPAADRAAHAAFLAARAGAFVEARPARSS
jgi:AcrR family transcriptional regulator